jgi:hypothetical protein
MKKLFLVTVITLLLMPADGIANAAPPHSGRCFYIDPVSGNDANPGTVRAQAWATLEKVNSVVFQPGDRILFRAGTVYTGQLKPKGSGKEGAPIIVDRYGVGSKPRIDGQGLHRDTVLLENVEFWEVNNLEVTNLGPERKAWQTGIKVFSNGFGTMRHIHLKNLYVHDVNGDLKKETEGCGIIVVSDGEKQSRFDGLLIEDCHVLRTDRNGICMKSEFVNRSKNWFPSLNVVIRGNRVEDCGGDGIKPWGADGGLVEYNVVEGARRRCDDPAAGIWPWSCDNTLIQYNEASDVKGTKDGQGFDSDYNSRNSIFQYNYSHDNEGGFILICSMPVTEENIGNTGTIVRYNISQNDKERIFHITGEIQNTSIYNNVVYTKEGIDVPLVLFDNWRRKYPRNTRLYNNIFYADGKVSYLCKTNEGQRPLDAEYMKAQDVIFSNNVFYGNHVNPPHDPNAITDDPMLVDPGSGGSGLNSLDGYALKPGSPCIDAGKSIDASGILDFWGNKVKENRPCIGVHEIAD